MCYVAGLSLSSTLQIRIGSLLSREKYGTTTGFFLITTTMDPVGKEVPLSTVIKIMNDQAQYEVRRNVCLAVLLYFGSLFVVATDV